MNEWQPIETAPKNGACVLLYEPKNKSTYKEANIFVGLWDKKRDSKIYGTQWACAEYDAFNHYPTCWMPLPKPPEGKE